MLSVKNAIIGVALLLAVAPTIVAQAKPAPSSLALCSQDDIDRAAKQVESNRAALLALPTGDGMETDVSPGGQKAILGFKESIGIFVNAYMKCAPLTPDTKRVQHDLSRRTHAFSLPHRQMSKEEIPSDYGKYGFQLGYDVRLAQSERLVGIIATFDIECGSDAVLFIFRPDGGSWQEVLRWQSKPYATIGDAFWAFDYRISPPDKKGRWYVMTKHIAPWCSSTWSAINYAILRPQMTTVTPKVLLSGSDSMWWGNQDFGRLVVGSSDSDLRFHSSSIDAGVHNRVWIRHFRVSGDTVTRTQPVAVSPRDFVDEWLTSPWEEASKWSSKTPPDELRQAHQRLSKLQESVDKSDDSLFEHGSVYRCSNAQHRYQVELVEHTGEKFDISRSFYFDVTGHGHYTMTQVSETPDPACKGRDLLNSMSTR